MTTPRVIEVRRGGAHRPPVTRTRERANDRTRGFVSIANGARKRSIKAAP